MRLYRSFDELSVLKDPVVTFGSFDGVHLGHLAIFNAVKRKAEETGGTPLMVTFEPHPRLVIYPLDLSTKLITSLEEKIHLMEEAGVEHLLILPFTIEFSQIHPDEYIQKVIVEGIKAKHVVIGYDHRFGLNRLGDINFLSSYANGSCFTVTEIPAKSIDASNISSSKIRIALQSAELELAAKFLGHTYIIKGRVIEGMQKGRELGYPTANLSIVNHKLLPPAGIYIAKCQRNGVEMNGLLYIGKKPTVSSADEISVEFHIFNFQDQIYGQELIVEVLSFIRPDQNFESLDALIAQMNLDRDIALEYFQNHQEN